MIFLQPALRITLIFCCEGQGVKQPIEPILPEIGQYGSEGNTDEADQADTEENEILVEVKGTCYPAGASANRSNRRN